MATIPDTPIENLDATSSPAQSDAVPSQADNSLLGLDGSLSSIHSVSLVLQALIPLLLSLVLLVAGRRLYRFTTTVSVGSSGALFTWALFVNLENGQSIGGWTGEVAALTVWSVMIGGGLIGAIIGYQFTWWGAHVTGRLCLGANSGVAFAFSMLLFKAGLLIHTTAGQWSLISVCAFFGVLAVLCDHVIGPLVAISLCGSFLFLLGVDLFATAGNGGVAAGLRLLMDHNPDHQALMTPYTPSKSTAILIVVSWVITVISFGFQYMFYKTPFGPLPPRVEQDEEERLGSSTEGKHKESFSQGSSDDAKKEISKAEIHSNGTEHNHIINITDPRTSTGASIGTKTSATLVDSNRAAGQQVSEPSNLPYLSSRVSQVVVGEYSSTPALALSPTVYSRYRRTLDAEHKPPGRSPIQYNFSSNLNNFTNLRRVETVDEVTETSNSARGGDLTPRSSMLNVAGTSDTKARSNSMSEEYLHAMMRLATGEGPEHHQGKAGEKQSASGTTTTISGSTQESRFAAKTGPASDVQSERLMVPITENQMVTTAAPSEIAHDLTKQRSPEVSSGPVSVSAPMPSLPTPNATNSLSAQPGSTPDGQTTQQTASSDARDKPNSEPTKSPKSLSKWPSCSSFGRLISTESRVSEELERGDGAGEAARARPRCPGISISGCCSGSESTSRRSHELGGEPHLAPLQHSLSQGSNSQSISSEKLSQNHSNGSHEVDPSELKRFSHRPLPLLPDRGDAQTTPGVAVLNRNGQPFKDTYSFNSATSNSSSGLDSFTRVDRESSVPTTPSWSGNILQEDHHQKEEVNASAPPSSRKKLSIIVTKNPVQVDRGSMTSPMSQEAERDQYFSDFSTTGGTAVPHTPTMGNMLLRVADNTEKLKHQANTNHDAYDDKGIEFHDSNEGTSREDDGDTVKSESMKRSTICRSSIYTGDHTTADEGGRSSSGSEYDDEESQEETFYQPGTRLHQRLNDTMGELRTMIGVKTRRNSPDDLGEADGSPSLQSIPLPSRDSQADSSSYTGESTTTRGSKTAAFIGQPLAEVPWPQRRPPSKPTEPEKRWTTASSIFPPLGYDSSDANNSKQGDVSLRSDDDSSDSGTDRTPLKRLESFSRMEAAPQPAFCSASSHVADGDYDIASSVGHADETDADDPYESAADYSRSVRASHSAAEGGYITADDERDQSF